jgi:hypothetical protein
VGAAVSGARLLAASDRRPPPCHSRVRRGCHIFRGTTQPKREKYAK